MRGRKRIRETEGRAAVQDARNRRLYAEAREAWLERLAQDEPAALGGASPQDQRQIRDLYARARACWPEAMPEGWRPPERSLQVDPFHVTIGLLGAKGAGRMRPRTYRAGERLPDGRVVGQDQTETVMVDIGVDHARALLAYSEREASPPPPPEPEPERMPPAKFTAEGILAALTMPLGTFTGTGSLDTAGEVDPRMVGALGQTEGE